MYDITICVVTYDNRYEQLKALVESIGKCTLNYQLFISDNSPSDKIRDYFKDDRIEYVFNNSNSGFGAGHNAVINRITGKSKYHLVINPDISFEEQVLEEIFAFMESNKEIGLLMPKMLNNDFTLQFLPKLFPSPVSIVVRKLPLGSLRDSYLRKYEMQKYSDTVCDIPIASGCFSFFRTNVLSGIGGYDDKRFFMYFEDFDISRRVKQVARVVYYPNKSVVHDYERGAGKSFFLFKAFVRSMISYFNKWGWFFDGYRDKINKKALTQKI